ncbi:hypothetical protein EJ110_NYTH44328 [Nymphaea thermarum]|nr:hypothetical protein EJ110_NYTH44328 [Nymphaea thermarum]
MSAAVGRTATIPNESFSSGIDGGGGGGGNGFLSSAITAHVNFIRRELKTCRDDIAMSLLCRKAFPGIAIMPLEFQEVCKSILQKCRGVPLAIPTLGGILPKKRTVCQSGRSVTSILKLSYDELPFHLKP